MKELLKNTNKSEWLIIMAFKIAIYACWYLLACLFTFFLKEEITDIKLILLVICLIITYTARNALKYLYKKNASDSYYNLKHSIEMHYFNKLKDVSYEKIETIDKNELSSRIIEVSYNYTKIINDIGEYIIPAFLGLFVIFIKLLDLNLIFGILVFFAIIGVLVYSYNNLNDDNIKVTNYNDLLVDFISKMETVKKLNIFDYCSQKLNINNKENDLCILKNNDTINDIKFTNFVFAFISIILISTFIFESNTITRLGIIIFFIIIILKLQDLLYKINPAIKNMFASSHNKALLDSYFNELKVQEYETDWKKISVKDGIVKYKESNTDIKIPNFELIKKDHISIMGKSGQGKSTILNVLSGIFKLSEGNIYYDGNISNKIVDAFYTSTKTEIFKLSLRDNLTLGKEINDEELIGLIDELDLKEWFSSLNDGLDTILNYELDLNIKQRLNLIRAIVMDKDIYFLDEPTMDLDIETEKKIAEIIKRHFKDKTYIIVSHRPVITNICKKHYFIKDHTLLEKEPLL